MYEIIERVVVVLKCRKCCRYMEYVVSLAIVNMSGSGWGLCRNWNLKLVSYEFVR